jgi:Protein of unknown function (DUF2752)
MATASDIPRTATEVPPVINGIAATSNRSTPIILFAVTITLGAIVALVYFILDPTKVALFPPCLFHQLTGLDCPGCGGQRALHQLLHGHLIAAVRLNAMFVVSLPLFAWVGFRLLARSLRHEPIHLAPRWWSLYLAAWIIFGVLRNLPFPVCQWFAA